MTGQTLSHYRIDAELGRGGMGIVYRATDTKLNRTVALKVLPAAALASPDDRARFVREAQSAAQLHHPNIATVFGIDEAVPEGEGAGGESRLFIAMEYIEGETLRERAQKGPMRLQEAVSIAGQIAEALKEAHAKDIVHRDIKSANIMLTGDGVAKVLDFGLAKTNASTMLTRMGSTLGTVAYMSPEQARGQEVDGRSDLYSLGTVLYEMVAGVLPFAGDYEQAVLYSILNETPEPLTAIRTGVPMQLEWIVNKLLAKEAEYRYQTAADLLADLKSLDLSGSGRTQRSMPAVSAARLPVMGSGPAGLPKWAWGVIVGALLLGVAAGTLLGSSSQEEAPGAVIRATLDVTGTDNPPLAVDLSEDGRLLAFVAEDGLHVRDLQTGETWSIPETSNVRTAEFDATGTWLLMDQLRSVSRVQVRGGRPIQVATTVTPRPSSVWAGESQIVYDEAGSIKGIDLTSGERRTILVPDSSTSVLAYDQPFVTADGRTLLTEVDVEGGARIGVFDYPSGELRGMYEADGDGPQFLPTGHLLYFLQGQLIGVPFDLDRARAVGPAVPLADDVLSIRFDVSPSGHQVSFAGPLRAQSSSSRLRRYVWDGAESALPPQAGNYDNFDINADGRRVVIELDLDGVADLWTLDLVSGVRNRLTFDETGNDPKWHPSGDSVLYVDRGAEGRILLRAADGSGSPRELFNQTGGRISSPDPHPGFGSVAFVSAYADGLSEIRLLDTDTGESTPVVGGEGRHTEPAFSPDGRFLAYTDRSGTTFDSAPRILMQPTTFDGGRWDVSRGRGSDPRWSPDGGAVFYRWINQIFRVAVEVSDGGGVSLGNPEAVLTFESRVPDYDVLPDGSGVVVNQPEYLDDDAAVEYSPLINLVINWFEEVKAKAPPAQ